jgi:ABC-type branched-subunit amino acid transport system substrate-binding protein
VRPKLGATLMAALVLTAACGSRLPADTLKALDARSSSGPVAGSPSAGAANDTGTTTPGASPTAAAGGATNTGAGTGAATGSNGSTAGATGATGASAPPCTGGGSSDVGVTPTEIKASSIVTDSGPLPGATEGSYRGAAAYFAMVNAAGGVCGRKITLQKGDDGLDPAKARSEFERLEPKSFAMVADFAVADSGYIDLIKSTNVPFVGLTVDPSGANLPSVFPKTQRDFVSTAPFVWLKQQHPTVTRTALLYADIGGVTANLPGARAAIKKAGFDIVDEEGLSVTGTDYTSTIKTLQSKHVDFVYAFAFEVNMHVRFVRNMIQQGYNPPIKAGNIAFNSRFSELLGKTGDGWENDLTYLPFLDPAEPGRSAALGAFVKWNNTVFPGGQLDLFPVDGWGAAALFVDALRNAGANPTRKSLLDALSKLKTYDVGGIGAPSNPATGQGGKCFVEAKHVNGHWTREYPPASGYECNIGEDFKYR